MFRSLRPGRLPIALALLLGLSLAIHLGVGLTARASLAPTLTADPQAMDDASRHREQIVMNYQGGGYLELAEALVRGDGYTGVRTVMPLYPLMLAGLLKGFGYAPIPLLLLHAAFGVTITWAGYQIGRMLFSPAVGLVAGFLLALHPYLVKLTMQIVDTGPSVAFSSLGMVCLLRAWNHSSRARLYALAGLFFGLATLVRPVSGPATVVLAGVILIGLVLQRRPGLAVRSSAAFLVVWMAVMLPWWAHNWFKYDTWIPLTAHGGSSVLRGHTPYYSRVHPLYDTDSFPYFSIPCVANDPAGYQSNRLSLQMALDYVRQHPGEAILTDVRKVVWLYGWHKVPRSFANSSPKWDVAEHRVVDVANLRPARRDVLYTVYWVPVLALFLWGVWRSRSLARNLVPVYALLGANAVTVALTFADTRYRLEAEPLIAALAAFGGVDVATSLWRWVQERRAPSRRVT